MKKRNKPTELDLIKEFCYYGKDIFINDNFIKMKDYTQHGETSTQMHSILVAYYSFVFAKKLRIKCDYSSLVRGALLRDFFLYDWHKGKRPKEIRKHGFTHPIHALNNAQKEFNLSYIEMDIIKKHMFPLTLNLIPRTREACIVSLMDKVCSIKEMMKKNPYSNDNILNYC